MNILNFFKRKPDFIIGDHANPYMLRWWVIPRNSIFNIYLHCILRSDDDRALHDHPWYNLSLILKGGYWEVTPYIVGHCPKWYGPGALKIRDATYAHRLVIQNNHPPCWTLFITGPRVREWGFHCPKGWVHWKDFCATDSGQVGKGCGEHV